MIYYLIGILAVAAIQVISAIKQYENNGKLNKIHIVAASASSIYLVAMIEVFHRKTEYTIGNMLAMIFLFVPMGIVIPLVYGRIRTIQINVLIAEITAIAIMILSKITAHKVNFLMLLFPLIGWGCGFLISTSIASVSPEIRRRFIIRKKKKGHLSLIHRYEWEIVMMAFMILFSMTSGLERAAGKDFNQTLKNAISTNEKKENKYEDIYYADVDKYKRYDAYAKLHPEMSTEDVVWRVDANLDQEFYDDDYVEYVDENTDKPLLINKFHRVSDDYEPEELVTIEGKYVATQETTDAYQRLTRDLQSQGMKIYIVSSYRSTKYQKKLYNGYLKKDSKSKVDTYSSRPGYSEHHTGRALDISQVSGNLDMFEGSDEAKWVYENAYKYGFIVRYMEDQIDVTGYIFEPWHIVYVGTDISYKMHDENIKTLEEYVVKYVDHTP